MNIECPYCKAKCYSQPVLEGSVIGDTVFTCHTCRKAVLKVIAIEKEEYRPEFTRYIYSLIYQHCVNHPEIMFNQAVCPVCKLESNLKELNGSDAR